MTLALKLGRTLEELGSSMSSEEFSLWLEMYQVDLWGELRAYERAGVVASTVANYAGMMRSKSAEPAKPSDFMPLMGNAPEEETEPDPVAYFSGLVTGKDR